MRFRRRAFAQGVMVVALCQCTPPPPVSTAGPVYLYASQTGRPTLDQDEDGGNPFASVLVELLTRDRITFDAFRTELIASTKLRTRGFQLPEVLAPAGIGQWRLLPKPSDERRVALILVFSDYSGSSAVKSLPGARHDLQRIAVALDRAGFDVRALLDPNRAELETALSLFAMRSADSDVAVLYTTGHGAEVAGTVYLLPGDYPFSQGAVALGEHALRLATLASALRARHTNLVFYGGCRNNLFGRS